MDQTTEATHKVYDIDDVADYIIIQLKGDESKIPLTNLKLQKLLYYVQAWSLGILKRPFFDGEFQAWVHGPVNRRIYDRFYNLYMYSEIGTELCKNKNPKFDDEDSEFIDFILENYMKNSGFELESMTHREKPWIDARGGIPFSERCENVISKESMMSFYGKRWEDLQARA